MEARDLAAAAMTVALVAAGVILATVIMNRFDHLLSLVEEQTRPERITFPPLVGDPSSPGPPVSSS